MYAVGEIMRIGTADIDEEHEMPLGLTLKITKATIGQSPQKEVLSVYDEFVFRRKVYLFPKFWIWLFADSISAPEV